MKILVVDDDRETVDLLTYCLRGFGYEVVRAFDGAHALTEWREQRPDLRKALIIVTLTARPIRS